MSADDERRVGMEVDQTCKARVSGILAAQLPDIDPARRALLTAVLVDWRNEQIAVATNKLARQHADQLDRHDTLRDKITREVDDWMIDKDRNYAEERFARIGRLLAWDEKGLPL